MVRTRGCELWIRPKLPIARLLFLLGYARDPKGWREDDPAFGEADSLVEALVRAFVRHAERALARGLLQGYRSIEDAQPAIRGRIREADQLRRRFALPLPVEVRYDDYTTDIVENQLLRAATRRLLWVPGVSSDSIRRLRRLLALTREVSDLPSAWMRPLVTRTRLNQRYFPAVRLAELALRATSPEFTPGAGQGIAFLFDMNKVFEDFITAELGVALQRHGGRVKAQHPRALDAAGQLTIKPDLTWWSQGRCLAVADIKYKSLADQRLPRTTSTSCSPTAPPCDCPRGTSSTPTATPNRPPMLLARQPPASWSPPSTCTSLPARCSPSSTGWRPGWPAAIPTRPRRWPPAPSDAISQVPAMVLQDRFHELLVRAAAELYQDNRHRMDRPDLIPTPNVIDSNDLELFFEGLERGLISVERGGKFNTLDRPVPGGHWSLLSRRPHGGWYNAEYLPQLAAYVELIRRLGYPADRVLFELPPHSLQLDLAVITDAATVAVLGEAKRAGGMLDSLAYAVRQRFSQGPPGEETKRRGDEARQLAWRLWLTRTTYLWLVGPGVRHAYHCSYDPLTLHSIPSLPPASTLGLAQPPPTPLGPPPLV